MKSSLLFLNLHTQSVKMLEADARKALALAEKEIASIVAVPLETPRTTENTLNPLNRAAIAIVEARSRASLLAAVHPNPKIRKAAETSLQKVAKFFPQAYLRRDLYEAVKAVPLQNRDEMTRRFVEKELLDFRLTGIEMPERIRREIKALIAQSVKLGQAFDRNIKDDVRSVTISAAKLDGLPEDYRHAHAPDQRGRVHISTQYPDYFPFMKYAEDETARRALNLLYLNRGWPKNKKVFSALLAVRKRQANLIGFANWADYATADKMTGSAKTVQSFLDQAARLVKKSAARDQAVLLARKKKNDPTAHCIEIWELSYYENLVVREKINLDTQAVRDYFPFAKVRDGILAATEKMFGLSFRRSSAKAWHPDVRAYDAYRGKRLIGRFYLDLHPREGKYGHAACFDIRPGIHGTSLPEAALICNFSRDLMSHSEVTTFFHEFGHLLHFILAGDQRWARFSGIATEWDFVEAPSQMLETWAFDPTTLRRFARHQKTGKPIPRAMVKKMEQAEHFCKGIWTGRQIFLAMLSLRYHEEQNPKTADLDALLRTAQKKYGTVSYPRDSHFYASFGHLSGYSALYYTYVWSRAIAEDLLTAFKKEGLQDVATARRYAATILTPGGSQDARDLIRNFLGRNWNLTAYRRWLEK